MNAALRLSTIILATFPPALLAQSDGQAAEADPGDRKVRIEITTTEDGRSSRIEREFDLNDERSLQDALRELGVMDELGTIGADENLIIDLRRMRDGGALKDMSLAFALRDEAQAAMHTPRGYLGAYLGMYNTPKSGKGRKEPDVQGIALTKVIADGPADKAGLKDGDVVVAMDGETVGGLSAFTERIRAHKPGDVVMLTVLRDGERSDRQVTLGEAPDAPDAFEFDPWDEPDAPSMIVPMGPRAFLGVNGDEGPEVAGEGARIGSVVDSSAAQRMGLLAGDRIVAINDTPITGFGDLAERIARMEPGATVRVEVLRDGDRRTLTGTLGERRMRSWVMPPLAPMAPLPPFPDEDRATMRREMDELRREMEQLRRTMRSDILREMHVEVGSVEVSPEERALLERKGAVGLDRAPDLGDLRCAPNPSDGFYRIQFNVAERGDLVVDVHNAQGDRIYHETVTGFKGRYERTLDLSDQADGTYFLVVALNGKATPLKLVKH